MIIRNVIKFYIFILYFSFLNLTLSASNVGIASWYGDKFQGKTTASGEFYEMSELTAAHKDLDFGTIVKVTNLLNNKTVQVKINDRGPFRKDRIIELSKKAAETLDFIRIGVAPVKIEVIKTADGKEVATSFKDNKSKVDSSEKEEREERLENSENFKRVLEIKEKEVKPTESAELKRNEDEKSSLNLKSFDNYIQIGSFKIKEYALSAFNQIKKAGFNVYVNRQIIKGEDYYTVYITASSNETDYIVSSLKELGYTSVLVRESKVPGVVLDFYF